MADTIERVPPSSEQIIALVNGMTDGVINLLSSKAQDERVPIEDVILSFFDMPSNRVYTLQQVFARLEKRRRCGEQL